MMNGLKILPTRSDHVPTWINANILDQLWKVDKGLYKECWVGDPIRNWFEFKDKKKYAFKTADAHIYDQDNSRFLNTPYACFTNGRHRSRWLMSLGFEEIPIGLKDRCFKRALLLGIPVRRVADNDTLPLPKDIILLFDINE